METEPNSPTPEQTPNAQGSRICGFWKRVGAFIIDMILIGGATSVLSNLFMGIPRDYVFASTALPFLVSFAYWTASFSRSMSGQSLGMRALKIQVVDASGHFLSLSDSAGRAIVLCIATTLPGMLAMSPGMLDPGIGTVIVILMALCSACVYYLAIFNRRTRQSLHDLVARSYVVHTQPTGPVINPGISQVHYFAMPALFVLVCLMTMAITSSLRPIGAIFDAVSSVPGAAPMSVGCMIWHSPAGEERCINITMILANYADPQNVAAATAKAAIAQAKLTSSDVVSIRLVQPSYNAWVLESSDVWGATGPAAAWMNGTQVQLQSGSVHRFLIFTAAYSKRPHY